MAIGTTAFDGAKEGPLFNASRGPAGRLPRHRPVEGRGAGAGVLVGLAGAIAVIAAVYALGIAGMGRAVRAGRLALAGAFVHALIPIAAAYVVAHYFSLLAYNGQDLWRLASDPLGDGSDLFGTGRRDDRLRRRLGDRHLVRAGRRRSSAGTCGARARPRPRARPLRVAPARRPARSR